MYSLDTLIAFVNRIKNEEMAMIALEFLDTSPAVAEHMAIAMRERIWKKIENEDYN